MRRGGCVCDRSWVWACALGVLTRQALPQLDLFRCSSPSTANSLAGARCLRRPRGRNCALGCGWVACITRFATSHTCALNTRLCRYPHIAVRTGECVRVSARWCLWCGSVVVCGCRCGRLSCRFTICRPDLIVAWLRHRCLGFHRRQRQTYAPTACITEALRAPSTTPGTRTP